MTPPRVLLVEIGTPAELPPVTPPAPRPPSSWTPNPRPSPGLAPPTGLAVEVMADAAKLTWTRSTQPGALTVVEGAPDVDGTPGAWIEITRTADQTYTIALPSGAFWVRLYATLNGRDSIRTNAVVANPVEVGQAITDLQQQAQEMLDDFADMDQRVDGVQAEAQQAAAALNLRADQLRSDVDTAIAQVGDILNADVHSTAKAYPKGDLVQSGNPAKLYRAKQNVPTGIAITNTTYWEKVGDYASLGEAVAANIRETTAHADELGAHASFLNLLGTKNALGTAINLALDTVRVSPTETLGQRLTSIQSEFGTQSGRIDTEIQTRSDADAALSGRIDSVQATANNAATKAELTSEQQARAGADSALGTRISNTLASVGQSVLLMNPDFELEDAGWQENAYTLNNPNAPLPANVDILRTAGALAHTGSCALRVYPPATAASTRVYNSNRFAVGPDDAVYGSIRMRTHYSSPPPAGTRVYFGVRWFDAGNGFVSDMALGEYTFNGSENYFYGNPPLEGESVAPAGTAYGRFMIHVSAEFSGAPGPLYFDAAQAMRLGVTASEAMVLQVQEAAATATGAVASDLALLGAKNAAGDAFVLDQGKAQVEPGVSLASRLSGISASIGQNTASINEVREVSVAAASGNLVADPSFEENGWNLSVAPNANVVTWAESRTGSRYLRINADPSGLRTIPNNALIRVSDVRPYRVGFSYRRVGSGAVPNGYVRLAIRWYDASLNQISFAATPANNNGADFAGAWSPMVVGTVMPPAGARWARMNVQANHTSGAAWAVDDVFMEPLSDTVAEMLAKYTLAVQAGGDIAGIQLLAGGGISAFRILASMFSIVDPGGTGGYTHSAGVSVWRIGSAMIAIGPGFGAGNEFVFWAGPNQSNLNNCTRANAGMYFTRTNDAYFGGTLTAGALYHPSQATFTAYPINVQAEVGPFVSNGGKKQVSSQFRYRNSGTLAGNVTGGHGQRFDGTITIYRRIGTGAWTSVNSYPVTGVKSAIYQAEMNRTTVNTVITGSVVYDDTSTSMQNFSYRAVVTALDNPTVAGVPVEGEVTIASKEG